MAKYRNHCKSSRMTPVTRMCPEASERVAIDFVGRGHSSRNPVEEQKSREYKIDSLPLGPFQTFEVLMAREV